MLFPSLDDCFKSQHSTISFILVLMKDLSDTSIAQFFWQCAIFRALPQSRHADLFDERHNENRNGRIRRYLPKGTGFEDLAQEDLDAIVGEINDTPMKLLGYKTPNEVWDEEIAKLQSKTTDPETGVALTN